MKCIICGSDAVFVNNGYSLCSTCLGAVNQEQQEWDKLMGDMRSRMRLRQSNNAAK